MLDEAPEIVGFAFYIFELSSPGENQMPSSFRPASLEDKDFLWSLHRETLREYVEKIWGWDEEWQRERFFANFDPADRQIIEADDVAIGMLQVDRQQGSIFLKNIQISPSHQRKGIGTQIIRSLMQEADRFDIPLRLQVLRVNPVRRFYERLDFRETGVSDTHAFMEYEPMRGSE